MSFRQLQSTESANGTTTFNDNISDNGNIVNDSDYDATQIKRSNRTPALPGSVAPSDNNVSNNGDVVNSGKQYSIGMDDKSLQRSKQISPNSFDGEGKLLSLEKQISNMENDPLTYGRAVIDTKDSLKFAGIDNEIYLTSDAKSDINSKHYSDDKIIKMLNNLDDNVVFATDYVDNNRAGIGKAIILKDGNTYNNLGLKKMPMDKYIVDEITTLYDKSNIVDYLIKSLRRGNNVYLNDRSGELSYQIYKNMPGIDELASENKNIQHILDKALEYEKK